MKAFLGSFIKFTLGYFVLLLVAYIAFLCVAWFVLRPIQHIDNEYFADELAAEGPLVASEYINSLNHLSLREKSYELIRAYNRRCHIIAIVRERLRVMSKFGNVSNSVESVVERNLSRMEKENRQIRAHYDKIVAFAEVQHAQSFLKTHSPDAEEKARLFAAENRELLRAVEIPMSFK